MKTIKFVFCCLLASYVGMGATAVAAEYSDPAPAYEKGGEARQPLLQSVQGSVPVITTEPSAFRVQQRILSIRERNALNTARIAAHSAVTRFSSHPVCIPDCCNSTFLVCPIPCALCWACRVMGCEAHQYDDMEEGCCTSPEYRVNKWKTEARTGLARWRELVITSGQRDEVEAYNAYIESYANTTSCCSCDEKRLFFYDRWNTHSRDEYKDMHDCLIQLPRS